MKKWTALILFGVLLTSAGCGNAPADSAVQETKATTETTEEVVYTDPVTYAVYETLDALTADFPKKQPGATQYQPPQAARLRAAAEIPATFRKSRREIIFFIRMLLQKNIFS